MFQMGADWIYGIAAVMLLGTVALQAVPDGTYQKYVRLFLGTLLMLAVLSPLFSLLGLSETTRLSFEKHVLTSWFSGSRTGEEEWQAMVQQKQENWMREPLEALAQEYGFVCTDYSVGWNEAGDWPEQITMWLGRQEVVSAVEDAGSNSNGVTFSVESERTDGTIAGISSVEPIQQVGQNTLAEPSSDVEEAVTYYEPSELRQLHRALQTVWQLEEEQILLYWER